MHFEAGQQDPLAALPRLSYTLIEQRLEAQNRELATLLSVQQAITSRLDRQEVLQMIADGARQLTHSSGTAVYLLEEDVLRLEVLSDDPNRQEPGGLYVGYTIPLKQSLGQVAFETGKPLLIADVQQDPRLNEDLRRRIRIHSYLGVPLMAGGEPIGLIVATDKVDGPLTKDDERILTLLASSAVIGLENARLYQEAEKSAAMAERGRLARDLHDAVTQTLFSASLTAEVLPQIWERSPEEGQKKLKELRELTRGALAEMRTLLMELRPDAMAEAELKDLLRHLTNAFIARSRIPTQLAVEGMPDLPLAVKIAFYRIAQEALNNIMKHSEASQVTIQLSCHAGQTTLLVNDNGQGFVPDQAIKAGHYGLRIMRERAVQIGAVLQISSQAGQGTQTTLTWKTSKDSSTPSNRDER